MYEIDEFKWQDPDLLREQLRKLRTGVLNGIGIAPWLSEALQHDYPLVRLDAAMALRELRTEAKAALPALVQATNDENQWVRTAVIGVLRRLGPEAKAAIPALVRVIREDKQVGLREMAIDALAEIGPDAKVAIPSLENILINGDDWFRWFPDSDRGYHARISGISQDRCRQRYKNAVARALASCGDSYAGKNVPRMISILIDGLTDPDVRKASAIALGTLGPSAQGAIPALIAELQDKRIESVEFRCVVVGVLGKIEKNRGAIVPALMESLTTDSPQLQRAACDALRQLGPDAAVTVPMLIEMLATRPESLRMLVVRLLGQIGPPTSSAIPAIEMSLQNLSPHVSTAFAQEYYDSVVSAMAQIDR